MPLPALTRCVLTACRAAICFGAMALPAFALEDATERPPTETPELDGDWRALEMTTDGQANEAPKVVAIIRIEAGQMWHEVGGEFKPFSRLRVEADAEPKRIDVIEETHRPARDGVGPQVVRETAYCIYKLDVDTLTIVGPSGPSARGNKALRPKDFEAKKGNQILVLERVKTRL